MKPKKKPLLPVDIKLPERVLLEDFVMFATLRTLDELEQFREEHKREEHKGEEHKGQFELACEGKGVTSGQTFLREYEWGFGTSKSAVVRTVMSPGLVISYPLSYPLLKIHPPGQAMAWMPFFSTTVSRRRAGPPGFFTPRSQSETRFLLTFR